MEKNPISSTILKIAFIVVLIIEGYYCYTWLIEPIIPVIQDLISNKGVPSFDYSVNQDLEHPLSISLFNMDGKAAVSLLLSAGIRFVVFSFLFSVTIKVYRLLKNATK